MSNRRRRGYALTLRVFGRGGEQNPARRLLQHVLGRGPDLRRLRGTDAAQAGAAFDLAGRLAADDDRLGATATGSFDDPRSHVAGTNRLGNDLYVLVLLAH